jgi:hypothetical protein
MSKCPYCPAEYSTDEEVARHLGNVWEHLRERLAEAEKELAAERIEGERVRQALADVDTMRCGGTKLLRPAGFKNPCPEFKVGIECGGCKDCAPERSGGADHAEG